MILNIVDNSLFTFSPKYSAWASMVIFPLSLPLTWLSLPPYLDLEPMGYLINSFFPWHKLKKGRSTVLFLGYFPENIHSPFSPVVGRMFFPTPWFCWPSDLLWYMGYSGHDTSFKHACSSGLALLNSYYHHEKDTAQRICGWKRINSQSTSEPSIQHGAGSSQF